jgi:crotonobetainyl-CoA:carnitine CoA-transferase CaiB-like acyl-CoA transferase
MLSPYRVLDLTIQRGLLCGQILGDLGADVIAIEPPGSSPARRLDPFYGDEPHPDRSLFWWAYNRNKRSVTLDITTAEGRDLLQRLVRSMAPHGVYPVLGEDRWVAIAVASEAAWHAFCDVLQQPELAYDERFASAPARLAHQDDLDAIVSAWTRKRQGQAVEAALQARGVAACAVPSMYDMYEDPHLAHRGHFVHLDHPIHGTTTVEGSRSHLSRTPAHVQRAAPTRGQDTRYVLESILGYSTERIDDLAAQGMLQ